MKEIQLTQGKVAFVDDADFAELSRYRWYALRGRYAVRYVRTDSKKTTIYMHRAILRPQEGLVVDHMDGNGFNNQRSNLRACTQRQNLQNMRPARLSKTSSYKGVSWAADRKKWQVHISVDGKHINLGRYEQEANAARAYDVAARKYFGQFAKVNFDDV